jgi:hypothetical protein
MDFHRLFKRKEEVAIHPMAGENQKETLGNRVVSLSEGDLLDGQAPANLLWNNVGGAITIRADKILGILEGRTRIKAAVLQEMYPTLFEKDPHPGTEFFIPLQVVVTQLEDVFAGISAGEVCEEDFETPFGQLAREDDARFKEEKPELFIPPARSIVRAGQGDGSKEAGHEPRRETGLNGSAPEPLTQPLDGTAQVLETEAKNGAVDSAAGEEPAPESETALPAAYSDHRDTESNGSEPRRAAALPEDPEFRGRRAELPEAKIAQAHYPQPPGGAVPTEAPPGPRKAPSDDVRREGHEALRELFLTDEQLDGSKVASLVLQLPRVTGVVIMLADGAVLGGGLSGGISESLLSLTPGFVHDLARFTESMRGGPARFVTLAGNACLISLTIGGQVLMLVGHEGKNLPPGLRERLVATAHALNMIYGPQP